MLKDTDILNQPDKNFEDTLEAIPVKQSGTLSTIVDIENMANMLISSLPKLNHEALREEMANMVIPVSKNPTTFDINEGLALAQGYRDRLSEILNLAQTEFKIKKKCLDMLFDAVNLISKASSADKRRGEATMRYPVLIMQVETSEIFMKEVESIYNNVKTTFDSISRQASVISMQITLGERRSTNPRALDVIPQSAAEEVTDNKSNKTISWDDF